MKINLHGLTFKLFYLFVLLLFFQSCTKEIKFKTTEDLFDFAVYNADSKNEIKQAHKLLNLIVNSYQSKCLESGLKEVFFDSMSLMKTNNVSANFYLSQSRESMISIFKSTENKFTTFATEFPVQFYLIQKPNYYAERMRIVDGKPFLEFYDSLPCSLEILDHYNTVSHIDFEGDVKFIRFYNSRSLVILHSLKFEGSNIETHKKDSFVFPAGGVTLLCSDKEIEHYFNYAGEASNFLFNRDIQDLFVKSEYFREISAIDILKPLANAILVKKEQAQQSQNFKYDIVEFLHDKNELKNRIDSFDIKIKVEDVFADAQLKLRTGTLLWFYYSYKTFSIQWFLINIAYSILLIMYKRYPIKNFPWDTKALFIFGLTFNTWVFHLRPLGMGLMFWYPFLFVIFYFYLLFIYKIK